MLSTKFQFIWESGFSGEDFLEINQSETRIACGGHFCKQIRTRLAIYIEELPQMLPSKFRFNLLSSFREESFQKSTNQKQELPVAAMFVNRSGQNEQGFLENLPQMLPTKFRFIWPIGFRGKDFLEIDQSDTRIACGGHVCNQIGTK